MMMSSGSTLSLEPLTRGIIASGVGDGSGEIELRARKQLPRIRSKGDKDAPLLFHIRARAKGDRETGVLICIVFHIDGGCSWGSRCQLPRLGEGRLPALSLLAGEGQSGLLAEFSSLVSIGLVFLSGSGGVDAWAMPVTAVWGIGLGVDAARLTSPMARGRWFPVSA